MAKTPKTPLERMGDDLEPILRKYARQIAAVGKDPLHNMSYTLLVGLADWFATSNPSLEVGDARAQFRKAVVETLVQAEDAIEDAGKMQ